jgi:uncharacterized protein (TIGR02996 family)
MRTFQYSDAKSHKFWAIEVSGSGFTVTFGKVGSAGQTETKTFASPEKARAEADKLIREKLKKGYVETTPRAAASEAEAFEEALRANPHDLAAACAYADYLAERGDPRGEFMQVQLALEADGDDPAEYVILRWPYLRNVRRFQFGWQADEVYDDFCHFQCHLRGDRAYDFVKQMPDVEEVLVFAHLDDASKLVALPMANLRLLQLYHGWSYPLEKLAKNATLTNLTHLLCHPHALDGGSAYLGLPQLKAVCRSPHLTSLTHLRLRLTDFGDRGATEVVESGILKRLKVLDLRHGCVTDEGARLLAGCPDLRHLERLDLSRNALTEAGMDALRATKVPVDLDHQHGPAGQDEDEETHYLYSGDYE